MNRILIFLITVLLTCNAGASHASEAGLLWKISGEKANVYLLGVLPFATQAMYPLPSATESAFEQSQRLLVYVDLLSLEPYEAAQTAAEMAKPAAGLSMQDLVSADSWKRVKTITEQHQIPQITFVNQEPWLFAWSLNWFSNAVYGFDENKGMDRHLLARARGKENKEIIALRTYAEWLGELDRLNEHEHELLLKASLVRIEAGSAYPAALVDAWIQGDADRIASLHSASLEKAPKANQLLQRLVEMRNSNMLERLKQVLKQDKGDTFAIVHAEQVVGEQDLPALLRKAGFEVERL